MMEIRYNYIGSNRKNQFKVPAICFGMELLPSYAISDPDADNSLYLYLAGAGSSKKGDGPRIATKFSGYVSGTQGCSCSAYGHKSPTRLATVDGPSKTVVEDAVATFGRWTAKWRKRTYPK